MIADMRGEVQVPFDSSLPDAATEQNKECPGTAKEQRYASSGSMLRRSCTQRHASKKPRYAARSDSPGAEWAGSFANPIVACTLSRFPWAGCDAHGPGHRFKEQAMHALRLSRRLR